MNEDVPIVYVRGFAGRSAGIDEAVEDPFYGFNLGSTHVRVGGRGDPVFHQFESPLLRLMIDHDYQLLVHGGQRAWLEAQNDASVPARSLWIHRFYDVSASTWGDDPESFRLERAAEDLFTLITLLQSKTAAERVHLVAHSMGGLICRCLLQKVIPERAEQGDSRPADEMVGRLFTYATPHGGIAFDVGFGLIERIRDRFGIAGADIFGPERMREYLTPGTPGPPPSGYRPQDMPDDAFPKDRIFSLIGTNPEDYDVARGLSARAVGAKSDGLVQTDRAYVPGAKFAFVHRSHSGRYGIVNSEEGYQNLRRFLFGDLTVEADLIGLDLPGSPDDDLVWQAEVELAVRGLPVLMHQQVAAHYCPITLERPRAGADRPVPLVTTFLIASAGERPDERRTARYSLHLRVLALRERRGMFDFRDHLEANAEFEDLLVVDVGTSNDRLAAWAVWSSQLSVSLRDYEPSGPSLEDEDPAKGTWVASVSLPSTAREILGDGAAVRLTVSDRGRQGREGLQQPGLA